MAIIAAEAYGTGLADYFAGPLDLMRVAFAASLATIVHTASGYYVCMYQCVRSPAPLDVVYGMT